MKPMLACDWNPDKIQFPVVIQPKIDGVRALTTEGYCTGRSLKRHANRHVTEMFSAPEYAWLDGEMAAWEERHPELCRKTSSALSRIEGEPYVEYHVFDYLHPDVINLPYVERLMALSAHVKENQQQGRMLRCKVVPTYIVDSMDRLLAYEQQWLDEGYEGVIGRKMDGKHKQGRCTAREGLLWRIKRFIEEEATVVGITEGETNMNEAQENELGHQFRSSHQDNMVPNGRVGSLQCRILKDSELFKAGDEITVSKGEMTEDMARHYFENQNELIGQVIKFKHFPKGVKDKPRFPTFRSVRAPEDMG